MGQLEQFGLAEFEQIWEIMEESFPVDERRDRLGQETVLSEPYYHLYGYRAGGGIAAFFAVWEFEQFSFIEHFAVKQNHRNGGIGAILLTELLGMIKHPVILEVEPPEGELPRRRIGFYERNGFVLNPYAYEQPAMSKEGRAIPLMIMSAPQAVSAQAFEQMRDVLYRHVYKAGKR